MAGEIKRMIDKIIVSRSSGSELVAKTIKTRLSIKGINPDKYTFDSPDDPAVVNKLREIAKEMGMVL
jgi:uncharacterized Fe-S cluster-containing radical SAM superfamily protein